MSIDKDEAEMAPGKSASGKSTCDTIPTMIESFKLQQNHHLLSPRHPIAKMLAARRQAQLSMLPYREESGAVKYVPASCVLDEARSIYDDDGEPLISNAAFQDEEISDLTQRFTATGGPMPVYRPSMYVNLDMYSAPQLLPQRYTDDSIIPVVILIPDPLAGQ
jgi:hypothetical protein